LIRTAFNRPESNNLADWLAWLETLDPSRIELGLDRIREVYSRLPAMNASTKVVTIAGTNGKGSCLAALQTAALAAGKSVVSYSSPHLLHYNERIQVQGTPATDNYLVDAFVEIADVQNNTFLTYFEFATLAALCIAAKQQPDLLILEVGLGGRLDSVNLIDADIVVLTAIGMDHMDWLGNDIESIAYEKCGVIRRGRPLVLAAPDMPATVTRIAEEKSVVLYSWGIEFELEKTQGESYCLRIDDQEFQLGQLLLHAHSVGGALMVAKFLWPEKLPDILESISSAKMPGRYQKLNIGSTQLILDVAHNPMALAYLVEQIKQDGIEEVELIFAIMSDKDCSQAIEILAPLVKRWQLLELNNSRALPTSRVAELLAEQGVEDIGILDIQNNLYWKDVFLAKREQSPLLVTGSFYTVAAILEQPEVKAAIASNSASN